MRAVLLLLTASVFVAASSAAANVDDYSIRVHSLRDIKTLRQTLIAAVWGKGGLPATPSELVDPSVASPIGGLTHLDRVEKLATRMPRGSAEPIVVSSYLFVPRDANRRLVVLHNGHGCPATFDDPADRDYGLARTIRALVERHYSVLAVFMPLQSDEQCEPGQHAALFDAGAESSSGLRFFLTPAAAGINYALARHRYRDVSMIGFSGGGWTATVYAALDPRVRLSIPVAGSVPLYLRKADYSHDEEQFHAAFYSIAGYPELYVLGAAGKERREIQVLNLHDPCCFGATHHDPALPHVADQPTGERDFASSVHRYESRVQQALKEAGDGAFRVYIASGDRHEISDEAIREVILPALAGRH